MKIDMYRLMNDLRDGRIELNDASLKPLFKRWKKNGHPSEAAAKEHFAKFVADYEGSKFRFYDRVKTHDGKLGTIVSGRDRDCWENQKVREFYILRDGSPFCWLYTEKQLKKV